MREEEMIDILRRGEVQLRPFDGPEMVFDSEVVQKDVDAILRLRWGNRVFDFVAELKSSWSPKVIEQAVHQVTALRAKIKRKRLEPMIVVPFLSEDQLTDLERQGVSGLDLCGNGVIVVPGEVLVFRSGAPNLFRREGFIKQIYRGTSSVVARLFLLESEVNSVSEAQEEIKRRGGDVSLATVSKVCAALDDDLIVQRGRSSDPKARSLKLLQPDKLLDRLAEGYRPPDVRRNFVGKTTLSAAELIQTLESWGREEGNRIVRTGADSVDAYAVMARDGVASFYCSDVTAVLTRLSATARETERFPNLRLLEARDGFVYFDARPGLTASPIQTYLELMTGDKRDRETADQVRRVILAPLANTTAEK